MTRCFCAIAIPADITQYLSLQRGGLSGARWIEPMDFHITLQFFGNINRHVMRDLELSLADIHQPALSIILDQLDIFGGDKPRALFARVAPSNALSQLHDEIAGICRHLNISTDKRNFSPHVTLARLKQTPVGELVNFLSARSSFEPQQFTAKEFGLYTTKTAMGGGPYVCQTRFSLQTFN